MLLGVVIFIGGIWMSHGKPTNATGKIPDPRDSQMKLDGYANSNHVSISAEANRQATLSCMFLYDVIASKRFRAAGKNFIAIEISAASAPSWEEARAACRGPDYCIYSGSLDLNGDLASMPTQEEFEEITAHMDPGKEFGNYWVGLKTNGNDYKNDWHWLTGQHVPSDDKRWDQSPRETGCGYVYISFNSNRRPELSSQPCDYVQGGLLCQIP